MVVEWPEAANAYGVCLYYTPDCTERFPACTTSGAWNVLVSHDFNNWPHWKLQYMMAYYGTEQQAEIVISI